MKKPVQLGLLVLLIGAGVLGAWAWRARIGRAQSAAGYLPRQRGSVTFTKDVAPIVFNQCSGCHRPGQAAPFSLLSYDDARKHARQIAEVTAKRFMPPWLPEPGYGEFVGERTLTADQLGLLQQWAAEGAREGAASDLPPWPKWTEGWHLGPPDLVVTMPEPYTVPAEGKDIYRNFVIPIPINAAKYVKGVEFQPGNRRLVHHAFIRFNRTSESRRWDERDPGPGFGGPHLPASAEAPPGQFLSYQPGKVPIPAGEDLAWTLEKGTDLVLQMHLQPTGKPEPIQSSVGLYFAERPTSKLPFTVGLSSYAIDIPAGKSDYFFEEHFQLPADVDVLSVLPHTHYLGKDLQGFATLPDGSRRWLFWIKNWDFNWQGEYLFRQPLFLPKGSVVAMRYTYDNSDANVRNPHHPPERVRYGLQSSDEMGEMWLQLLAHDTNELAALEKTALSLVASSSSAFNLYLLEKNPRDATAHNSLGKTRLVQGKRAEAREHFLAAIDNRPDYDEPHYFLGVLARLEGRTEVAKSEFLATLRLNPDHAKAHGNLGVIAMESGELGAAEYHFRNALRLNPQDGLARENLDIVIKAMAR